MRWIYSFFLPAALILTAVPVAADPICAGCFPAARTDTNVVSYSGSGGDGDGVAIFWPDRFLNSSESYAVDIELSGEIVKDLDHYALSARGSVIECATTSSQCQLAPHASGQQATVLGRGLAIYRDQVCAEDFTAAFDPDDPYAFHGCTSLSEPLQSGQRYSVSMDVSQATVSWQITKESAGGVLIGAGSCSTMTETRSTLSGFDFPLNTDCPESPNAEDPSRLEDGAFIARVTTSGGSADWSVAGSVGCGPGSCAHYGPATIDEKIRTVSLDDLSNPSVVMGPPSYDGAQPTTVRVREATSTSFRHNLQEWNYLDGGHVDERIGYLALEAGSSSLGALQAEAGSLSVNHNWSTVSFSGAFFGTPVVVAQVASADGSDAVTTRVRNVTSSGFEIRLQEEEANGNHVLEDVHWVAVEQGSTTMGGDTVVVGTTGDAVTQTFHSISFGQSLAQPIVFLAQMQSFNGGNTASLRHRNLTGTGVEVKVEEEKSADGETAHLQEEVGYIVFGN